MQHHLFGTLSKPVFGDRICCYCKDSITVLQSYPQHLVSQHLTDFDLKIPSKTGLRTETLRTYSDWLKPSPSFNSTVCNKL